MLRLLCFCRDDDARRTAVLRDTCNQQPLPPLPSRRANIERREKLSKSPNLSPPCSPQWAPATGTVRKSSDGVPTKKRKITKPFGGGRGSRAITGVDECAQALERALEDTTWELEDVHSGILRLIAEFVPLGELAPRE